MPIRAGGGALGNGVFENEKAYEHDFGDGGGADGIACKHGSYNRSNENE